MSDLRSQIRALYAAHHLPSEKADAILARGRAEAAGAPSQPVEKVVPFPQRGGLRSVMAWAAAVALCAGLAGWWLMPGSSPVQFAAVAPRVAEFLDHQPALIKAPQDTTAVRAWLVAHGAPPEMEIPQTLRELESVACQVVDVQGRKTYLACFWREQRPDRGNHELVHLVVARRGDFSNAPTGTEPELRELPGWSFASWAKGKIVYTLATAAPPEKLRPFVAAPLAPRAFAALERSNPQSF